MTKKNHDKPNLISLFCRYDIANLYKQSVRKGQKKMKKIFKSILVVLSFVAVLSFGSVNTSEASVTSSSETNCELTVVRTVENGVHYISIYLNDAILVMKVEEL